MPSFYETLKKLGIPLDHHESDLYVLKIKRGKGKLNVTDKMIELAYYAKKGYWHGYSR
jgi:hypothetical protein